MRIDWHAANNGAGRMIWFVTRDTEGGPEYLDRKDGQLVRFASYETAQRRADDMNRRLAGDTAARYWTCTRDDECGTVIEGRSIMTCASCWDEILQRDLADGA